MSRVKIFYVEDEPSLGKIVSEYLESKNFEVSLMANGLNAAATFKSFEPDICVLDVMLPHKDGYTIAQEIRALKRDVPIIFLTAKNQTRDVIKGFESGGNDYIRKPFSMEELIVRIKNLLSLQRTIVNANNSAQENSVLKIGEYLFYPIRQELHHKTSVRRVSNRESELLLLFAKTLNHTVTRKQILDEIWGNDSIFNSRNLDVYINKLREYLKDDDTVELITLKGVGYRLIG